MNVHTSHTFTHTYMDTDAKAKAHTQLYIHPNTFMPTYTSMCQHPRIYKNTCIHTHILASYIHTHPHTYLHSRTQALTYTCTRALTRIRAYKTKMHLQTIRT